MTEQADPTLATAAQPVGGTANEPAIEPANEPAIEPVADAVPAAPVSSLPAAVEAALVPHRRRRRLVAAALALVVVLLLAAGAIAGGLLAWDAGYEGKVLPGVHVGGVDLSGMDGAAAMAALEAAYRYQEGRIILRTPDGDIDIAYGDVLRRLDAAALVNEAMAAGRGGEPFDRVQAQVRQALDGTVIAPRVLFDEAALRASVAAALATLQRDPVDATIAMGSEGPLVTPSRAGRTVNPAPLADAAVAAIAPTDAPSEVVLAVTPAEVAPALDDRVVADAWQRATRMIGDLKIKFRAKTWTIRAATIRGWIRFATPGDGTISPMVDPSPIAASLRRPTRYVLKPPVNAQFLRARGGRVVGVVASKDGRELDVEATTARIVAQLQARALGTPAATVAVATARTFPKLTTEEARKTAPVMTRLGRWTTYFPISERNYFGANIWRPAEIIDGTVLSPGQTFDWWSAIWPVTTGRGFGPGGIIRSDHTDPTGALGGGMCSSSTTLFNAAMRAGLRMGARSNHKYYINRYPLGLDATVSIVGNARQTMTFTNDTGHPIVIRGIRIRRGSSGYVRYEIWGIPDGRTVSLSRPAVGNVRRATTNIVYVDSLPRGVREQTEYPSNGMDVSVTRVVRNAAGRIIHRDTWVSHYVLWNGRIEVGR